MSQSPSKISEYRAKTMLEGFGSKNPKRISQPTGKPPNPPSTHLRNLAWLRFLLDRTRLIRAWALGRRKAPPAWHSRRAVDAAKVRQLFLHGPAPTIPRRRLERPVALLDAIFDDVLHGKRGRSGLWFGDKVVRGVARPDARRLKWLDDLVPGSAEAFEREPKGLDPWFYGALDFQSPWYARIHLWRTMDQARQDPGWEALASETDAMEGVPAAVWARRHHRWTMRASDVRALRAEIALALAHIVYPDEINNPDGMREAEREVRAARAASERDPRAVHPVARRVRGYSEHLQWTALSDALAALRLERLLGIEDGLAVWWVQGVMGGAHATIERQQHRWFCSLPHQVPPLEGYITALLNDQRHVYDDKV
jgi:hypothetical protein